MAEQSRRGFLQSALTALGIVGVGSTLAACDGGGAPTPPPAPAPAPTPAPPPAEPAAHTEPAPAPAGNADQVNPNDAMAKTLKYVEDASTVDTASAPTFKEGSKCANCQLFQGAEGDEWGACTIFQGKKVKGAGWCASWAPKA